MYSGKGTTMRKRTMGLIAAVAALCLALAGCGTGGTSSSQSQTDTGTDTRWANFDDGSDVLSVDVPYFNANADDLTFNIKLEGGTFGEGGGTDSLSVSGALEGWTVAGVTRTDDTTLSVEVKRPADLADNGASLAAVTVAGDVVNLTLPSSSSSTSEGASASATTSASSSAASSASATESASTTATTADSTSSTAATEASTSSSAAASSATASSSAATSSSATESETTEEDSQPAPADATIVNKDYPPEESEASISDTDDANITDEGPAITDSYTVSVMYVAPALTVDSMEAGNNSLTVTLEAKDLSLDADLSKDSFAVRTTAGQPVDGVSVSAAHRVDDSKAQVTLALPSDKGVDALDGAQLVLLAAANESEADVVCPVEVATPWVDLAYDYRDEQAGTTTFAATVTGTDQQLSSDNTEVKVNGQKVDDAQIAAQSDGTQAITLKSADVPEGAVVSVDMGQSPDAAGRTVEVDEAAAVAEPSGDTKGLGADLAKSVGGSMLSSLANTGWQQFVIATMGKDSEFYDVTNEDLQKQINQVQDSLTSMQQQLQVISTQVEGTKYAVIVNSSNQLISRTRTEELLLKDDYQKVASASAQDRKARAQEFATKNVATIEDLATDLGTLYESYMNVESLGNRDLITAYDTCIDSSFNWGALTYEQRQQFRNKLAAMWANGKLMLVTAYVTGQDTPQHTAYLNQLDQQTNQMATLITTTKKLDTSVYVKSKDGVSYYYCNTLGGWYRSYLATQTPHQWYNARLTKKRALVFDTASPFRSVEDHQHGGKSYNTSWDAQYASTAGVRQLIAHLPAGQTLDTELKSVGMATAQYLVTDDRSSVGGFGTWDVDWYMDVFETAKATTGNEAYTHDKQVYHGTYGSLSGKKHEKWKVDASCLFTLKKE